MRFSPGISQEHGKPGAGAEEYGVELAGQQLIHRGKLAHDGIELDVHAQRFYIINFSLHNLLRQPELGDAVHQHAAGGMQGFVHGYLVAELGQVGGGRQPGGARADNCHFLAGGRGQFGGLSLFLVAKVPVRHVPFDAADGDGGVLLAQGADRFALSFLRADPAADGGERVLAL